MPRRARHRAGSRGSLRPSPLTAASRAGDRARHVRPPAGRAETGRRRCPEVGPPGGSTTRARQPAERFPRARKGRPRAWTEHSRAPRASNVDATPVTQSRRQAAASVAAAPASSTWRAISQFPPRPDELQFADETRTDPSATTALGCPRWTVRDPSGGAANGRSSQSLPRHRHREGSPAGARTPPRARLRPPSGRGAAATRAALACT